MRNSYILEVSRGGVVLLPQITDQLTLARNSTLYGVPAPDGHEPNSYVLSTIPPQFWQESFRLQTYVAHPAGSLSKVAAALSRRGINIFTAWTAATSPNGEGCLTAIVQIALDPKNPAQLQDLQASLLEDLSAQEVLSESRLFRGTDALSVLRLTKLRVLARLGSLYAGGPQFKLQLDNASFNLERATDLAGRKYTLVPPANHQFGNHVLITPDTEERYLRLAILQRWSYKKIHLRLKVKSAREEFTGYYEKALEALAEESLNIFSSNNTLISKEFSATPSGEPELAEEAQFSFLINSTKSPLVSDDAKNRLQHIIAGKLESLAKERGAELNVPETEWRVDDLWQLDIPVFLATNAKPSIDAKWNSLALRVIRILKGRGLRPVNVEISKDNSLNMEVESLLRLCPLLVSLYLPEEGLRLAHPDEKSGRGYAPSDYTMFEESLARALGTPILCLRHEEIFRERYLGDMVDYEFGEASMDSKLLRFESALDAVLASKRFLDKWNSCRELEGNEMHRERDLEGWLLGEGR